MLVSTVFRRHVCHECRSQSLNPLLTTRIRLADGAQGQEEVDGAVEIDKVLEPLTWLNLLSYMEPAHHDIQTVSAEYQDTWPII